MADREYWPRLVDRYLSEVLSDFAAVMVTGARAVGKTTTASQLAVNTVRLDRPGVAAAYRADPDAALRRAARPVLIDEWQEVPAVLGAVKRAVDRDPRPGQYLLTGSVRAQLQNETWAGTGRVVRMNMYGLTEREVTGRLAAEPSLFLTRLARSGIDGLVLPPQLPDIDDYVQLALRGQPPGHFPLGESVHVHADDPTGTGPRLVLQLSPHAPGQQVLTRSRIAIDGALYRAQDRRNLLPLVDKHGSGGAPQRSVRVGAVGRGNTWPVQPNRVDGELTGRRRLADGSRPGHHHGGEVAQHLAQVAVHQPRPVLAVSHADPLRLSLPIPISCRRQYQVPALDTTNPRHNLSWSAASAVPGWSHPRSARRRPGRRSRRPGR